LQRELLEPIHVDGVTYQQKFVWCGLWRCDAWHGPYWYAYYWRPGGRRPTGKGTAAKYIGRDLPRAVVEQWRQLADDERAIAREAMRLTKARKRK
jgi:hypothetical protein